MSSVAANLLSALAISAVISFMALLKGSKARALVYSLPIPITTALIATGGKVDRFSIIGIALVTGFLWGMYVLHQRLSWNILLADVLLAAVYVVAAYLLAKTVTVPFIIVAVGYLLLWVVAMQRLREARAAHQQTAQKAAPVWAKAIVVFGLAYALFTLKIYLATFVVTFPYSGVFAVYEGRKMLHILAIVFTRNSIAIWVFFIAYHTLNPNLDKWLVLAMSWAAYGVALVAVTKLFPLNNITHSADVATEP